MFRQKRRLDHHLSSIYPNLSPVSQQGRFKSAIAHPIRPHARGTPSATLKVSMQSLSPRAREERLVEAEDSAHEWRLVPYTQGILSKIGAECAKYSCSGYFGRRKRGIRGHPRRLEPPKPRKTPGRSRYSTTSITLTHRLPTPNRNILHFRTIFLTTWH